MNITERYTDTAAARLADIITKGDKLPFTIEPTPVQDLEDIANGKLPTEMEDMVVSKTRYDGQLAKSSEDEINQSIEQNREGLMAQAKAKLDEGKKKAEKAELRIRDWLHECNYLTELRSAKKDAAKLGTGVMKGPYPMPTKRVKYLHGTGLQVMRDIKPHSARVDPFNCFPDPSCGENIHNGDFHWERDYIGKSQLRALVGRENYFEHQIKKVLEEGPSNKAGEAGSDKPAILGASEPNMTSDRFSIWTGYSVLDKSDLSAVGGEVVYNPKTESDLYEVFVNVIMVNDRIIGIMKNPLSAGPIPYDYLVWSPRSNMPWGKGIPRTIMSAQQICNGATRAMMDNAGRASGPMLVYNPSVVSPAGNSPAVLAPYAIWEINEDSSFEMKNAFEIIDIPIQTQELQSIIQLSMEFAEKVTGMPWFLLGQQAGAESAAQQSTGAARMLSENASAMLREMGSRVDDQMIEPHIKRYYDYLLEHGPADDEKGDMAIVAKGAVSLLEKDLDAQLLQSIAEFINNPVYNIDPKKYIVQLLEAMGLDPAKLAFDDDEWKQVVEQISQPPPDPAVEVEKMRSEIARHKIDSQVAVEDRKTAAELIIEEWRRTSSEIIAEAENLIKQGAVDVNAFGEETKRDAALKQLQEKLQEKSMELKNAENIAMEQLRSKELVEGMKLDEQARLADRQSDATPTSS